MYLATVGTTASSGWQAVGSLMLPAQTLEVDTSLSQFSLCLAKSNISCVLDGQDGSPFTVNTPLVITGSNLTIGGMRGASLARGSTSLSSIMSVDSNSTNIVISNLKFDGRNDLWNWANSHANLKAFLLATMDNPFQSTTVPIDLNLSTANNIVVSFCTFANSPRIAMITGGHNVTLESNNLTGGLDEGIGVLGYSSNPATVNIVANRILNYRGAGLGLNRTSGRIDGNTLIHNASGDVDGLDIDGGGVGGGQIYITVVSDLTISGNLIDGCASATLNSAADANCATTGYAPPFPSLATAPLLNYGTEINPSASNVLFTRNNVINNAVAGHDVVTDCTNTVFGIEMLNEIVRFNRIGGIIAANNDGTVPSYLSVIGGTITSNGGAAWYNGSSVPSGYGLLVQGNPPVSQGVCYGQSGSAQQVDLSGNYSGPACGSSGYSSTCNANSGFYSSSSCPVLPTNASYAAACSPMQIGKSPSASRRRNLLRGSTFVR